MNMLQSELEKLREDVAHIKLRDFHLGNLLYDFVTHLAHAHGLDDTEAPASEPVAKETNEDEEDDTDTTVEVKAVKGKK